MLYRGLGRKTNGKQTLSRGPVELVRAPCPLSARPAAGPVAGAEELGRPSSELETSAGRVSLAPPVTSCWTGCRWRNRAEARAPGSFRFLNLSLPQTRHTMASLPSGQDAALAALSTTLFPSSPDPDADTEESLATKRRDSAPLSIRSDYTSATGGGNSVYADATGSAYGSQATIQREDSFADANSEAASHGDLASVAVGSGDEGGVEVLAAEEEEKQHDITPKPSTFLPSTTTPRPDSQTPPQSTFLPALVANPIDTPLATSNSTSTKAASFENEKSVPLAAGGGAGGSTPDETVLEDPELAHLNEQQRKIVAEQVYVFLVCSAGAQLILAQTRRQAPSCQVQGALPLQHQLRGLPQLYRDPRSYRVGRGSADDDGGVWIVRPSRVDRERELTHRRSQPHYRVHGLRDGAVKRRRDSRGSFTPRGRQVQPVQDRQPGCPLPRLHRNCHVCSHVRLYGRSSFADLEA